MRLHQAGFWTFFSAQLIRLSTYHKKRRPGGTGAVTSMMSMRD
jgi:hypothetical protein